MVHWTLSTYGILFAIWTVKTESEKNKKWNEKYILFPVIQTAICNGSRSKFNKFNFCFYFASVQFFCSSYCFYFKYTLCAECQFIRQMHSAQVNETHFRIFLLHRLLGSRELKTGNDIRRSFVALYQKFIGKLRSYHSLNGNVHLL